MHMLATPPDLSTASNLYETMAKVCDVVDDNTVRGSIKFKAVEISDEGISAVEPLSSEHRAHVLDPEIRKKLLTKEADTSPPSRPADTVVVLPDQDWEYPHSSPTFSPAPVQQQPLPAPAPTPPRPMKRVEFVGDIADIEVMCHEVTFDEKSMMLSILADSPRKFKFEPDQKVVIRHNGVEGFYWFTGISIPITMIGATLMVFGVAHEENPSTLSNEPEPPRSNGLLHQEEGS